MVLPLGALEEHPLLGFLHSVVAGNLFISWAIDISVSASTFRQPVPRSHLFFSMLCLLGGRQGWLDSGNSVWLICICLLSSSTKTLLLSKRNVANHQSLLRR